MHTTIFLILLFVQVSLQHVILLATGRGIDDLSLTKDGWRISNVVPTDEGASAVDFHSDRNEAYFIAGKEVFRASYNYPTTVSMWSACQISPLNIKDLVVDWSENKLYTSYYGSNAVTEADLLKDNKTAHEFMNLSTEASSLYINAQRRLVYYVSKEKYLNWFDLNRKEHKEDLIGRHGVRRLKRVAVDYKQYRVYVIGSYGHYSDWFLARTDYDGNEFKLIFSGPELHSPVSLDVYRGVVVWANYRTSSTLYIGTVSRLGDLQNLTLVFEEKQKLNDLALYRVRLPEDPMPSGNVSQKPCTEKSFSSLLITSLLCNLALLALVLVVLYVFFSHYRINN